MVEVEQKCTMLSATLSYVYIVLPQPDQMNVSRQGKVSCELACGLKGNAL